MTTIQEKVNKFIMLKECKLLAQFSIRWIHIIFFQVIILIILGSQDMNIRIWKSKAYMPTGSVNNRESRSIQYREKLIQKYKDSNKVRKIANHRHLPKYILNAKKRKQDQVISRFNKKVNKEANTGIKQTN